MPSQLTGEFFIMGRNKIKGEPILLDGGSAVDDDKKYALTDPDHSRVYEGTSGGFTVEFGPVEVAPFHSILISGHNLYHGNDGVGAAVVYIYDDNTLVKTEIVKNNRNMMIELFRPSNYTNFKVSVSNMMIGDPAPSANVAYLSVADTYFVESVGSGYKYMGYSTDFQTKTSTNGMLAPTAMLLKNKQMSGAINIPNVNLGAPGVLPSNNLTQYEVLKGIADSSKSEPIAIKENLVDDYEAATCYDISMSVKKHPESLSYCSVSLKYKGFLGFGDYNVI